MARTIDVPAEPQEVIVRPDDAVAYASCDRTSKVAVMDLRTLKVDRFIDGGRGVDGLAWGSLPQ